MSLVKCPECGKEVSDMAEKCPQCGIDIQNNIGNNSKVGKKRISKIIIFTCIIISFILLVGTCFLVPVGKKKIFEISVNKFVFHWDVMEDLYQDESSNSKIML